MTVSSEPPRRLAASGIRSKNAAPIRIPAPTAMISPTWRTARSATMPASEGRQERPGRHEDRGQRHVTPTRVVASGLARQAGRTQPEELEPVLVDAVAGPTSDLADDDPEAGVVDLAASGRTCEHTTWWWWARRQTT